MTESAGLQVIWDFLRAQGITLPSETATFTLPNGAEFSVEVPEDLVSSSEG